MSDSHPDRHNLHKALSGYRQDNRSQYIKNDFIASLESVVNACLSLAPIPAFKDLHNSLLHLLNIIGDFNKTFTKAMTDVHIDTTKTTGGDDGDYGTYAAGIEDIYDQELTLGGDADFVYIISLKRAINELNYYYKINIIKNNLNIAASQHKDYTSDYQNILGEECGILINKINGTYKMLTCESDNDQQLFVKDNADNTHTNISKPSACIVYNLIQSSGRTDAIKAGIWESFCFILEYTRSAKVEMIEAAQALDIYLSSFTEYIQQHPNEVKDFLQMLEQVEIVAKWFTEKSGDNLVMVFEGLGNNDEFKITGNNISKPIKVHYYEYLNDTPPHDYTELGLPINDITKVKEFFMRIEKSLKGMRALENIISMFSKISSNSSTDFSNIMSPGLIFKAFMKYVVATSVAFGPFKFTDTSPPDILGYIRDTFLKNTSLCITLKSVIPIHTPGSFKMYGIDPLYIGKNNVGQTGDYLQTDAIFEMCIKSMVAKVFTVLGMYSLFHRPIGDFTIKTNNALPITALRQVIGGDNNNTVTIIPEATEVYIRLTLLGEWYRDLFSFKKNQQAADSIKISMIPSMDGIWSSFIKTIFVDGSNITDGGYPGSYVNDIINGINTIYIDYKLKYKSNVCHKIIENFVAEINMRYGVVTQEEINKYIDDMNSGLDPNEYFDEDNVEFDILDSSNQFNRQKVPSDRFIGTSASSFKLNKIKHKNFKTAIDKFRQEVELKLNINQNNITTDTKRVSVNDLINNITQKLNATDDNVKKYNIIRGVIQNDHTYNNVDANIMLMFHETVITPCTILYSIYQILNSWNRYMTSRQIANGDFDRTDASITKILKTLIYNTNEYYIFDKRQLAINGKTMTDIIIHLAYLTCDKHTMVELYFAKDNTIMYPNLSFDKISSYVEKLIYITRDTLDKFRGLLPHSMIVQYDYDKNNQTQTPIVSSLSYIEEHLLNRLIKNKYGGGLTDSNIALKKAWIAIHNKYKNDHTMKNNGSSEFIKLIYGEYISKMDQIFRNPFIDSGNNIFDIVMQEKKLTENTSKKFKNLDSLKALSPAILNIYTTTTYNKRIIRTTSEDNPRFKKGIIDTFNTILYN